MSKVEPWRLKELAILLEELVLLLKSRNNPEWAGVFAHFGHELTALGPTGLGGQGELKRLIGSLRLCLDAGGGFSRLVLEVPESEEGAALTLRFNQLRAALGMAVKDIDERQIEFVS
jgi:hypothetical protein